MNINKYIPTYYHASIFELNPNDIIKKGYKIVFSDLDNTLDCYIDKIPSKIVFDKVKEFKEAGIKFIIISNNYKRRVKPYADKLGLQCVWLLLKPLKFRLNHFIKKNNINKKEVLMIGDQLFTDIALANKLGIDSILVKPLTDKDQKFTSFRRKKEKLYFKKIKKENKLKLWR